MAHGTCRECAAEDRHLPGRGLCAGCYHRRWKTGDWGPYDCLPDPRVAAALARTDKRCSACRETKPLEEFAKSNRQLDGRGIYCKACARDKYHRPARERKRLIVPPTEGVHFCRYCEQEKTIDEFNWERDKGRFTSKCKTCRRGHERAVRVADGFRTSRARQRFTKYGLTEDQYDAMLEKQQTQCAICFDEPTPARALAVDHDHVSGEVRALLCGRCNPGLGLFRDDPALLRAAAAYLDEYRAVR